MFRWCILSTWLLSRTCKDIVEFCSPPSPMISIHIAYRGKIALHLLFGWSLDKDEKSLDQSKQFSWQFGSIQTKAFPNPDQPPLEILLTYQYFCTKHKIIYNEKWKLLETLQYSIKEFNSGNVVCSNMHCPNGGGWGGGACKGLPGFLWHFLYTSRWAIPRFKLFQIWGPFQIGAVVGDSCK